MLNRSTYLLFVFLFLAFVFLVRNVLASEGLVELKSTTSEKHRCFVSSVLMPDSNFLLAVSCRDLLYPPDDSITKYSLWLVPVESGIQPIRIAELGLGRLELRTAVAFKELYVVLEKKFPGRKDTETVVMRGVVRPLTFLENPGTGTPVPESYTDIPMVNQSGLGFTEKIGEAIKRAGVAFFLFVAVCVGLVFVVLKSKG